MRAEGRVVAQAPVACWFEYELETGHDFVHRRLSAQTRWEGGSASLELVRDGDGSWRADGVARPDLDRALDCDLFACPMTNTMPILRHGLHLRPGEAVFLMAFVRVPTLEVVPNEQRYTHLGLVDGGARVRYASGSFESDLLVDADGFVVDYPQLGFRVEPGPA
jgi:hypothetical protein